MIRLPIASVDAWLAFSKEKIISRPIKKSILSVLVIAFRGTDPPVSIPNLTLLSIVVRKKYGVIVSQGTGNEPGPVNAPGVPFEMNCDGCGSGPTREIDCNVTK